MSLRLTFPQKFDNKISLNTQKLWSKNSLLNSLAIVIARFTPFIMVVLIAFISQGFLLPTINKGLSLRFAIVSISAALLARTLNEPIAKLISRPRPFEELRFSPLIHHDNGGSFPSNHATGAFALAVGCIHVPGYNIILCILAILLTLSRVYCGLHYASDVALGALHGILAGSFCLWVLFLMTS